MSVLLASTSSSDMSSPPTSIFSEGTSSVETDITQPEEPRVYDLYSYTTKSPNTRMLYIQSAEAADAAISRLSTKVLGFDLEWRPNFIKGNPENPVALVQLASEDTIMLIHVALMTTFPEKLKALLGDPEVVKAGVGIQKDCKKLFMDHGVDTRNCVDLSLLARTVDNKRWKGKYANPIGLSRLCETYEDLTLYKGKVQISNWERPLDSRQQEYAANDSHAGLVLYSRLVAMAADMSPVPHRVWYSFDAICGLLYQPSTGVLWHAYNPYYDPGPPPPPRPPKVENEQFVGHEGSARPFRAFRGRHNRTRPQRPLSPTAPNFVPGAKEHSPSPSPSPAPGFLPNHRYQQSFPRASDVRSAPSGFSTDMDGFPRLPRSSAPRQWQPQPTRPRVFRGGMPGAVPAHTQAGRGRGRGRGYAIAATTG
ncbi:ribonuclease H-like protein [Lentinus tigrinus ALCF2SS1-6]|uniref:Ribonuclease H-like protein n=1 Tax=Lentinus tigrinus ALCF2SS1-6 TaxID=1328759 RepID=A0A5C2S5R1_9APHY|nr:ribonuclease H-like protein [Lentinus tigrinus ALCF2SS1-6]